MRSHYEIIRDAGAERIAEELDANLNTVRAWAQRNSIPADQWKAVVGAGFTTLDELAEFAPKPPPESKAA